MLVGNIIGFVRPSYILKSGDAKHPQVIQRVPAAANGRSVVEQDFPDIVEISSKIMEFLGQGGACVNAPSGNSCMLIDFILLFLLPFFLPTPNIAFVSALGRVWFQQKFVRLHHIQLKNDLMLVTRKEPMFAILFKFVI